MASCDVLVLGGGHNGLVCAAMLAKSGRRVTLVEADDVLGGGAKTHEFTPGFRVSGLAHMINRLDGEVVRLLDLAKRGLRIEAADAMDTVVLSRAGTPLVLRGAYGGKLEGAGAADEAGWKTLRAQLLRFAGVLGPLMRKPPPSPGEMAWNEKLSLGRFGLALRRLGSDDMRDFLRMILMNVADIADEHLSDDRLKGLLAFDATLGIHLGPHSPTSLLGLLYRLAGESFGLPGAQWAPRGGMGALALTLEAAAREAGVRIAAGSPATRILVEQGRAAGAALAGGAEIRAATVVSALNPRTTFFELVGARHLETGFVRRLQNIRMRGDAAKLHLALGSRPRFSGLAEADHAHRLVIAPSAAAVEEAFNPAKYGAFSAEPVMEITLPGTRDADLAPPGCAVLSAVVQYAPYALKEGWAAGKPRLLEACLAVLEAHAPGVRGSVRHAELLTPADIERRFHMAGGHWHHGELQVDAMLMSRPAFGASTYDTPLPGLFLAGAGSHPGGGLSGLPGLNAARRVMEMVR